MSVDNAATSDSSVDFLKFVCIVKEYPAILDKSMTPECRRTKSIAYTQIVARFQEELGVKMTVEKIAKRLQNMKVRIKKKLEHPDARNGVRLKDWEREFLKFVEFEKTFEKNHNATATAPGVEAVWVPKTEPELDPDEMLGHGLEVSLDIDSSHLEPEEAFPSPDGSPGLVDPHNNTFHGLPDSRNSFPGLSDPNRSSFPVLSESRNSFSGLPDPRHRSPGIPDPPATTGFGAIQSVFTLESEETRVLNDQQLQRLVLLEQLRYYRQAQELVQLQAKRELQRAREDIPQHGAKRHKPV